MSDDDSSKALVQVVCKLNACGSYNTRLMTPIYYHKLSGKLPCTLQSIVIII